MPGARYILSGAKDRGNGGRGTLGKSMSGLDEPRYADAIA